MKNFVLFLVVLINSTLFAQASETCLINFNVAGTGSGQVKVRITADAFTPEEYTCSLPCTIKVTGDFLIERRLYATVTVIPDSMSRFVNAITQNGWYINTFNPFGTEITSLNENITINLERTKSLLSINNGGCGSGSIKVNAGTYALPYSRAHDIGSTVNLEAVPSADNVFASWSGDLTGKVNPVSILLDNDKSITANFKSAYCTLSVYKGGYGYGRARINGTLYDLPFFKDCTIGENVNIEAVPDNGSKFSCWSDSLSGSANPVSITMDDFKTVTANFSPTKYHVNINSTGNGSGSIKVNGITYSLPFFALFDVDQQITLEALPNEGCSFKEWKGCLQGNSNPVTITLNENKDISASFNLLKYPVNISAGQKGNGTVKVLGMVRPLPCSLSLDFGTQLNIEAEPDPGYTFTGWTGDLQDTARSSSILIDGEKNITANFILPRILNITKSATGNGHVMINDVLHSLPFNGSFGDSSVLKIEAIPDSGFIFTSWTDDSINTANPYTFALVNNKTITANFSPSRRILNITCSGRGTGKVKINDVDYTLPFKGDFNNNAQLNIDAIPSAGCSFAAWSGDLTDTSRHLSIQLDKDINLNAEFKLDIPTLIELLNPQNTLTGVPVNAVLKWKLEFDPGAIINCKLEIAKSASADSLLKGGIPIINPQPDINNYRLTELNYKTSYFWRISAESNGRKFYSDTWSFTTQCKPIAAPNGLTAAAGDNKVNLSWKDNSDNELYFAVLRKDGDSLNAAAYQVIDTIQAGKTSYSDLKIQSATLYTYKVFAFNHDTLSCFSNQASVTTSVTAVADISAFKEFKLMPNYPNPFNPVTVISYELPVSSLVELKVYTMLGQEVAVLVNETKGPGHYRSEWDASGCPSGFYVYKITVQQSNGKLFTETRKMMLVK